MTYFNYSTSLADVQFSNPIFTASGCAGSGKELSQFFNLSELGAIVTKSIMLKPRAGRATPRMAETPSGMLNSIGLQGPGIDLFLENDLTWLQTQNVKTVVSIAGETVEEFGMLAKRLRGLNGIAAIEVNISCPNVENRGLVFACDPNIAANVVRVVKENVGSFIPVIAKLTADVTSIADIAQSVACAGADGVALINTVLGMVIDINTMRPRLAQKTGGLSGPAIRPIAVRAIYQVRERLPEFPILGMGGVASGEDALQLIMAGANAISIGTASFGNPLAAMNIKTRLQELLIELGFTSLKEAVGIAHK